LKIAVPFDFDERFGFFLKEDLVKRLLSLNVDIVPLFYCKESLEKLNATDGLLIPGGLSDLDPQSYGDSSAHPTTKICKSRTDFEFLVLDQYIPTRKPILSLCWGFQMMNVYFKGSLYQHLPEDLDSTIEHEQKAQSHLPTHWVEFQDQSPGISVFGSKKIFVNSTHHQGVKKLGAGLVCEAKSEDNLIECVSVRDHPFFWGVQWHPERLDGDTTIPAFLKACRPPS